MLCNNFTLQKDGRTCTNGPINFLIFAHRVDIRIVSLDVPYLVDVVLPLPSLKNALGVDVDQRTGNFTHILKIIYYNSYFIDNYFFI